MALNAEDGGNRQCILVTNNENNICEGVTYERNKRVIQGYTNAKGVAVEGLSNNNLRYFKSGFVSREPSLENKRQLTHLATELLCIKENCYTEYEIEINDARLFANGKVTLLILFDDYVIPQAVKFIKTVEACEIKVYVFSMGSDPYTEDFSEVIDKVTLCALPDAIYKAYQNVLPKKQGLTFDISNEEENWDESGREIMNETNEDSN
jgi:adenine-specific DNA-methyltransferase